MDATGGEGPPVIGPDPPGQAKLAEGAFEDRAGTAPLGRRQAPAGEQEPGVLIRQRERVAPDPVPRGELPFEIGGPEIVGCLGVRRHDARMLLWPAAAALLHQALSGPQV